MLNEAKRGHIGNLVKLGGVSKNSGDWVDPQFFDE